MVTGPVHLRKLMATVVAMAALAAVTCANQPACAQDVPAAPADRILDDTRALSDAERTAVASQLTQFHNDHGYDVWIVATTFLSADHNVRQHARHLRQAWSPGKPAILLAYDRASDRASLTIAPALWDHYAAARLVLLTQQAAATMSDSQKPLNERITQTVSSLIKTLRLLEKHQAQLSDPMPASQRRLAVRFAPLLSIGAFAVAIVVAWLRRRDLLTTWQLLFPSVQVGTRFGAPFGGGVTIEWQPMSLQGMTQETLQTASHPPPGA